jgi:hypothetical protein
MLATTESHRSPRPRLTVRAVAGLLLAAGSVEAWAEDYQLLPIETRPAQTLSGITLDSSFRYFTDMTLDEADNFDGWTVDFDLTVPFMDRFQLRVFLPAYTRGDAKLRQDVLFQDKGESLDIHGAGGIWDFPSVELEHQLMFERDRGFNLGYYLGAGRIIKPLDTDLIDGDKYNHRGTVGMGGIKADGGAWNDQVRLLGNFGFRYYWDTDDLNPEGKSAFGTADLKGAAVFKPWGRIYPVLELTYLGNFSDVNITTLMPEIIFPLNQNLELKAAVPIGLGGDGNQLGLTAQLGWLF